MKIRVLVGPSHFELEVTQMGNLGNTRKVTRIFDFPSHFELEVTRIENFG